MTLYQERYRVETTRLENWDYAFPGWYFVTICTKNRRCSLAQWQAIPKHYTNVKLDEFVVMPNHVHGIVIIEGKHIYSPSSSIPAHVPKPENFMEAAPSKGSLSAIIRSYKSGVSRACRINGSIEFAWQERFYDQILRSNASANAVRDYIINNPRNWVKDEENPHRIKSGDVASYVSTPDF